MNKYAGTKRYSIWLINTVVMIVAVVLAVKLVPHRFVGQQLLSMHLVMAVQIIVLLFLIKINAGFRFGGRKLLDILVAVFVSIVNSAFIVLTINFLFGLQFMRLATVVALAFQFIGLMVVNSILWWGVNKTLQPLRVFIIAGRSEKTIIKYRLRQERQLKLRIASVFTDCSLAQIVARQSEFDCLVLGRDIDAKLRQDLITYAQQQDIIIKICPDIRDILIRGASSDNIVDIPVFNLRLLSLTVEQRVFKRLLDIVVVSLLALPISLLLLVMAIIIKLESAGPVFYRQQRVGRDGKVFSVVKLRSMIDEAEKQTGAVFAAKNDDRITKVGKFIRATRIDELPQLWNVFIGDMSLVGPRPERPMFVSEFSATMPEYAFRHNVKPGITGLAQIEGRYNTKMDNKLIFDLMYIQSQSFWGDIEIMLRTLRVLLLKSSTEGA